MNSFKRLILLKCLKEDILVMMETIMLILRLVLMFVTLMKLLPIVMAVASNNEILI